MESGFLTFILVSSFAVYSSHTGNTDWEDVMVARVGMPTTLVCTDTTMRGSVAINWRVKSLGADEWKLVLLADKRMNLSGGTLQASMRLTDSNFQDTGVFSLIFHPKMEDGGLYSCLIKQQEREVKEKIILLAMLTVTVNPAPTVLQSSTLRLIAKVNPDSAITKITWEAPDGISMRIEKMPNTGTVAKLPQVQRRDSGIYICTVYPGGKSSRAHFAFNVNVTVDAFPPSSADKRTLFNNVTHGPTISTAARVHTSFSLTCPGERGDFVRLHWEPDTRRRNSMKLVHQYDRWRGSILSQSKTLQIAGPPYNAEAGSFSFLLTPASITDGGLYICDVYLDDKAFSQRTQLSVLKVKTRESSSKLELDCLYSVPSQVSNAIWKYQNRKQNMSSKGPGSVTTTVPLPITSDTAGNYTCTLTLKNGQTIVATHAVTLPPENRWNENVSVTSLLPFLSPLLLLVPLVAAAVGVLLWRQKHISDRGIEQSLSVHSGEAENIYENPEDIKQAPPQGAVYMDLKPRGEDDVYKELERYEQCQT
ncbi:uncharacterized protein AKAME5_001541400 [Lates japonicus]|uniref:Ig-like domain-containing protein n=1 Tax=Lates japonicus TaxID=270547 RepID=A0AAD3RCB2_LATJO|nr:uncharacterized protein AKAME5_001541400 [Lates japonicus]